MTLALEHYCVGYRGSRGAVLNSIDLHSEGGAFICLLGRNGAGKSTLMRSIAGLQPALSGIAKLDDEDIATMRPATRARRIAVVLTERATSPGMTVDDVVALGRAPFTGWSGRLTIEDNDEVQRALDLAGALPFAGRLFDSLSDGERQRVMIARAIAQASRLMVLDEITAFLDLPGRVEVMTLLRRHAQETGTILLLSSHDLDLSLQLADTVWLAGADGQLHTGTPDALVRSGAIGGAFDSGDVRFSPEHQRFVLRSDEVNELIKKGKST
jgi:iron complex transport system ATP-binding protein